MAVSGLMLSSCFKTHDDTYLDELDITLTYYDSQFDFSGWNTYSMRDSIGLVTNLKEADAIKLKNKFYAPGGANDQIKAYLQQKYGELGYTFVATDESPDFYVNMIVAYIDNAYVVGYPGWWWGYYPYYSYYYYYWYPWYGYPWYYTTYNYQTGTLLMEMADGETVRAYRAWAADKTPEEIENTPPDQIPQIEINWQGLIDGVAGNSAEYNKDRAQRAIDEAFTQSPYLKKN